MSTASTSMTNYVIILAGLRLESGVTAVPLIVEPPLCQLKLTQPHSDWGGTVFFTL